MCIGGGTYRSSSAAFGICSLSVTPQIVKTWDDKVLQRIATLQGGNTAAAVGNHSREAFQNSSVTLETLKMMAQMEAGRFMKISTDLSLREGTETRARVGLSTPHGSLISVMFVSLLSDSLARQTPSSCSLRCCCNMKLLSWDSHRELCECRME